MTLGEFIKEYRKTHRMSMDELAKRSTLSKPYISMLEHNKNPRTGKPVVPSITTVKNIAKAMLIPLDELLRSIDQDISIKKVSEKIAKVPPPVPEEEKENLLMTLYADNPMIIKWLKENNFVLRGNMAAIKDDGKLLLKHAILSSIENEEKEKEK